MIDRLPGMPATLAVTASLALATSAPAGIPLGISIPSGKANAADFARFTKNTDIVPRLVEIPAALPPTPAAISLPAPQLEAIRAIGALPIIAWTLPDPPIDEAWDPVLREVARETRADGGEIWMRIAMPREDAQPDAAHYKRTFRRIVGIFREEDADHVRWVFVADVSRTDGPEAALGPDAFPGVDIVDLVGLRGLNWGNTRNARIHDWNSEWKTFRETFETPVAEWRALAPEKPIFVITATASTGGRKSDWVLDAVRTAADWNLAALVWFQRSEQIDWVIQESIPREVMMEAQTMNDPLANRE